MKHSKVYHSFLILYFFQIKITIFDSFYPFQIFFVFSRNTIENISFPVSNKLIITLQKRANLNEIT